MGHYNYTFFKSNFLPVYVPTVGTLKIFELKVDFPNVCAYIKVFPQLGLGVNN